MSRITRAKATEIAQKLQISEDEVLHTADENGGMTIEKPVSTSVSPERKALGEIASNGADSKALQESTTTGAKNPKYKKTLMQGPNRDMDVVSNGGGDSSKSADVDMAATLTKENSTAPGEGPSDDCFAAIETHDMHNEAMDGHEIGLEAPPSPPPSAVPKVIEALRRDSPSKRSTSNKENVEPTGSPSQGSPRPFSTYDALEAAAVEAASPTGSVSGPTPRPEDQIAALDELDEAVEKFSEAISPTAPRVLEDKVDFSAEQTVPVKANARTKRAPVVKPTRASQARLSLAQGVKPEFGRSVLGRSGSVRQSGITKSPTEEGKKREVVIPHSKPRPVSLSFPTPPPPSKSKKLPTTSTFQLPGEAVAAKLKAAREERMKKDVEEVKEKPAFKARPAPNMLKKTPSVRHTAASKARESMGYGGSVAAPLKATAGHKRANSIATTSVAKRLSTIPNSKLADDNSSSSARRSMTARPSTVMGTSSLTRVASSASASSTTPATGQRVPSGKGGTVKGKEVFNRAANAKALAEEEKRDKEEAAKKARLEAAERGRLASREWAEKQKLKKTVGAKSAAAEAKPLEVGKALVV